MTSTEETKYEQDTEAFNRQLLDAFNAVPTGDYPTSVILGGRLKTALALINSAFEAIDMREPDAVETANQIHQYICESTTLFRDRVIDQPKSNVIPFPAGQ